MKNNEKLFDFLMREYVPEEHIKEVNSNTKQREFAISQFSLHILIFGKEKGIAIQRKKFEIARAAIELEQLLKN